MSQSSHEITRAVGNGIKLVSSLLGTVLVAFVVRFWLPRFLGPEDYGRLHFSESLAIMLVGLTRLGINPYIIRTVSTNPNHASEFFGGVVVLRMALSSLLALVAAGILWNMGRPGEDWWIVYMFFLWEMAVIFNMSLGAALEAVGHVNELALIRVVSKLIWGLGSIGALALGAPLISVPIAFLASELLKLAASIRVTRKYVKLGFNVNFAATWPALLASLPFFLNGLAMQIYTRVDVYMISALEGDTEVGWYGAAANVARLTTLIMPVVTAVVLPMGSRMIANGSLEATNEVMQSTIRLALVFGALVAAFINFNAHFLAVTAFGADYSPTALTLQVLAGTLVLSYYCVIASLHLITLDRVWSVTRISLLGLLLNPALNYVMIPYGRGLFGDGGASAMAAAASVITEIALALAFRMALGSDGKDPKLKHVVAKLLGLIGCVGIGGYYLTQSISVHPAIIAVLNALIFAGGAWGLGIFPLGRLSSMILDKMRNKLRRRSNHGG